MEFEYYVIAWCVLNLIWVLMNLAIPDDKRLIPVEYPITYTFCVLVPWMGIVGIIGLAATPFIVIYRVSKRRRTQKGECVYDDKMRYFLVYYVIIGSKNGLNATMYYNKVVRSPGFIDVISFTDKLKSESIAAMVSNPMIDSEMNISGVSITGITELKKEEFDIMEVLQGVSDESVSIG